MAPPQERSEEMRCACVLLVSLLSVVTQSAAAASDTFEADGVSRITAWLRQEHVDPHANHYVAIQDPNEMLSSTVPVVVLYDYDASWRWVSIKGPPVDLAVTHDGEVVRLRCRVGVVVEVEQTEPFAVRPTPGGTECRQWATDSALAPLT